MKISDPGVPGSAVLAIFGDLVDDSGKKISGARILRTLLEQSVWLTTRMPKHLPLPANALFYQSGVGIVARARIDAYRNVSKPSAHLLRGFTYYHFPIVLALSDVQILETPISIRPLVGQLDFIGNKVHWGLSLRFSPRLISERDYETLTHALRMIE